MARISEQIIEKIRGTSDIFDIVSEYVQLKKRGRNFFGLCPFHDEKTPSFSINQERQIYKCFGCGAGGGTINFVMSVEKLEFLDAIKYLAERYNIELNFENSNNKTQDLRTQLIEINEKTADIYFNNFNTEEGKNVYKHLESRGLKSFTIKQFRLGFSFKKSNYLLNKIRNFEKTAEVMRQSGLFIDTENGYIDRFRGRIMFSIADNYGKIIAFAGRIYESNEKAKYVNSPETSIYNKSRVLYGIHESKKEIRKKSEVIIVEGYLDFLQLFQSGIANCVAVSGTAFTEQHALQLKRYCTKAYIAYDGDSAGKAAAIRTGYMLLKTGISTQIVEMPDGLDPDDWIKRDGNKPFIKAISNSKKLLKFHFENYSGDLKTTSGKSSFVNDVLIELVQINDPITQELHAQALSELIQVNANSVIEALQNLITKQKKKKNLQINKNIIHNDENETKQLLEEDLIRLCFAKETQIRKFLFDNIKTDWIQSQIINEIYEKVYIHLHSENPPEASIIMNELNQTDQRNKLAELIFDLEKITFTLSSAKECVKRLEKKWIESKILILRNNLKKIESSDQDPISIMKEIELLQIKKKNLFCQNETSK